MNTHTWIQIGILALGLTAGLAHGATSAASSVVTHAAQATSAPARVAPAKPVDLNSASLAELKRLPGITDAEAKKIIAARPYGSKAQLVTRQVLDASQYQGLKNLVQAKQPFKDAGKNAAQQQAKSPGVDVPKAAPTGASRP